MVNHFIIYNQIINKMNKSVDRIRHSLSQSYCLDYSKHRKSNADQFLIKNEPRSIRFLLESSLKKSIHADSYPSITFSKPLQIVFTPKKTSKQSIKNPQHSTDNKTVFSKRNKTISFLEFSENLNHSNSKLKNKKLEFSAFNHFLDNSTVNSQEQFLERKRGEISRIGVMKTRATANEDEERQILKEISNEVGKKRIQLKKKKVQFTIFEEKAIKKADDSQKSNKHSAISYQSKVYEAQLISQLKDGEKKEKESESLQRNSLCVRRCYFPPTNQARERVLLKVKDYHLIQEYLSVVQIEELLNEYQLKGELECKWVLLLIDHIYSMRKEE